MPEKNANVTRAEVTKVDMPALTLRSNAAAHLLANPNYFGTLAQSPFEPVVKLAGDTTFEQLTCVGLNAAVDQLEAVVRVNQTSGYSGPLCSGGSTEYVRFHISYDNGATWTDAGGDSFVVHDSAGTRPLDFAVNVPTPITHRWCVLTNQPLVRAILSWNNPPTPGDENYVPIWGNVVDVTVAPTSTLFPPFFDLLEATKLELPDWVLQQVDLEAPIPLKPKPTLTTAELVETYAKTDVAPHRFLAPAITKAVGANLVPHLSATNAAAQVGPTPPAPPVLAHFDLSALVSAGIDLGAIIAQLFQTDGDTSFEELGCVGYDPVEDALVGVLTVKKPNGYSGGPCTAGSTEYVAFWIDWGSGFEYAGTAVAQVHDEPVPAQGLQFAVYLPVSSFSHRQNCADGPVEPRVRAILSWEHQPPPSNPDFVPTWGNREETTIQLPTGAVNPLQPLIESISGVDVCLIDQATGLATGNDNPFGGVLSIAGLIPAAPPLGATPMKYRVSVREVASGGSFTPLNQDFSVWVVESNGIGLPQHKLLPQHADADGWFDYLEAPFVGNTWRVVEGDLLYPWSTQQPMTGIWEIMVEAMDAGGTIYTAQSAQCPDGSTLTTVAVCLDEIPPVPHLEILHVTSPGGMPQPTGPCKKFKINDVLDGTFAVTDEHFGVLWFTVEPAGSAMGTVPGSVGPTSYPVASTSGTSGTWTLDTKMMTACGYVMTMWVRDRTIVSGDGTGWKNHDLFGFSLEA